MTAVQQISPEQVLRMPGQPGVNYMLDRPPFSRYYWDGAKMVEFGSSASAGVPFLFGADGSDVTAAFLAACAIADAANLPVILPPWAITISQTAVVNRVRGTPGKSKIVLAPNFTKTGFANQFCILNRNFSQVYNSATADYVEYVGFDIESAPNAPRSFIGLANVRKGWVSAVRATATKVIGANSKPVAVDALLDLYACVKNVSVIFSEFHQLTEAYGSHRFAAGGGGCIWIRNLRAAGGTASENVTENCHVANSVFTHTTSDECIAIYGVRGPTRNCKVYDNTIVSPQSTAGVYHAVLLSIFPLDDGSGAGLGNTAAVYDNSFHDNVISDSAFMYNVVKIGNTADAARPCYNNTSRDNKVTAYRSSDASYGSKAVRDADSPGSADPNQASALFRCIEGTVNQAYSGALSGNKSIGDTAFALSGGAQINAAFNGWQAAEGPIVRGDFYTGLEGCRLATAVQVDVFGRAFFNCNNVQGGQAKVNGAGSASYCVFEVNTTAPDSYQMQGVQFNSSSAFVNIGANVVGTSRVSIIGCVGSMANAGAAAVINNANAATVVKAHLNTVGGSMSGPASGTGTTTRSGNSWAGTAD